MKTTPILIIALFLSYSNSFSQSKKTFSRTFFFESTSSELDSAEQAKAYKYLKALVKFNLVKIEIQGHTDSDGSAAYNLKLSKKRVKTISNLFINTEYDSIIQLKSFGENQPKYDNQTQKDKNRRVDVVAYYSSRKEGIATDKKVKNKTNSSLVASQKELKIEKENFKKGSVIDLTSVRFEGGTAIFLPGSEDILEKVIPILKQNPELKIEIAGHICCGNEMALSIARAKKVYDFLVNNGVSSKNLTYKGYNNTQPKYGSIMDIRNRRVELRVL